MVSQKQILKQRYCQILIDILIAWKNSTSVNRLFGTCLIALLAFNRVLPAANWMSDFPKGPFANSEFSFCGQYSSFSNIRDLSLPFSNDRRSLAVFSTDPYTWDPSIYWVFLLSCNYIKTGILFVKAVLLYVHFTPCEYESSLFLCCYLRWFSALTDSWNSPKAWTEQI